MKFSNLAILSLAICTKLASAQEAPMSELNKIINGEFDPNSLQGLGFTALKDNFVGPYLEKKFIKKDCGLSLTYNEFGEVAQLEFQFAPGDEKDIITFIQQDRPESLKYFPLEKIEEAFSPAKAAYVAQNSKLFREIFSTEDGSNIAGKGYVVQFQNNSNSGLDIIDMFGLADKYTYYNLFLDLEFKPIAYIITSLRIIGTSFEDTWTGDIKAECNFSK
ncbi:MAG: hypothetical protein KBD78_09995 [Oligoflexales bacterium]|nr:hypothetical protein [Oligoflexales bacterium]